MARFAVAAALLLLAAPLAAQEGGEPAPPRAVAARDLARGVALTAADVAYDRPPGEGAAGLAPLPVGWVTRRTISEGEVLRHPAIAPPPMVRAGEPVRLLWGRGAVRVSVRGTALGSAAEGERVAVRVDVKRRFEGIAVGKGIVLMDANDEQR